MSIIFILFHKQKKKVLRLILHTVFPQKTVFLCCLLSVQQFVSDICGPQYNKKSLWYMETVADAS